jgi:hypothetical protein
MPKPNTTADIDPETGKQIKEKIYSDINPHSGLKHNKGQPKKAPHAAAVGSAATFLTSCAKEHQDSLKCIERNYQNRAACEEYFNAYKQCRRDENDRAREKNSAGEKSSGGGWFW